MRRVGVPADDGEHEEEADHIGDRDVPAAEPEAGEAELVDHEGRAARQRDLQRVMMEQRDAEQRQGEQDEPTGMPNRWSGSGEAVAAKAVRGSRKDQSALLISRTRVRRLVVSDQG